MSTDSYADFYAAAEKEGNLNAGGAAELLPTGVYDGVIVFAKTDSTADGKKISLKVELSEGPLRGKVGWANLNLKKGNPRGAAAFFITCEKFGLTKDFFFRNPAPTDNEVISAFKDVPVTIEFTHREWNGKTVQDGKIVSVNKVAGIPVAPVVVPTSGVLPASAAPAAPAAFNPLGGGGFATSN